AAAHPAGRSALSAAPSGRPAVAARTSGLPALVAGAAEPAGVAAGSGASEGVGRVVIPTSDHGSGHDQTGSRQRAASKHERPPGGVSPRSAHRRENRLTSSRSAAARGAAVDWTHLADD